jgi:hypothetical protein
MLASSSKTEIEGAFLKGIQREISLAAHRARRSMRLRRLLSRSMPKE